MKYFFVSDIHLGVNISQEKNNELERCFVDWLSMVERERGKLYLLGDIFDFWYEYKQVVPATYTLVLGKLKSMVQNGIEIHFFKGNHDMWLRTYLEKEIGLIIHSHTEVIEIEGEKIMIGHGHDLCFKRTLTTRLLWILFNSKFFYNLFSAIIHPNLMVKIGKAWSKSSRKKKSVSHSFMEENEYITQYLNQQLEANFAHGISKYIFGHFHSPANYTMRDGKSQLVVLSEWSERCYYATYENGTLILNN